MIVKLFIADDHSLFREGMVKILSNIEGIEIIGEAKDGFELLEKISLNPPDVILLDLKMKGMSGLETMREIKKQYPEIKVIIITMQDDEDSVIELIENGANSYLLKDSSIDEVVDTIKNVVSNEYYYNQFVQRIIAKALSKKGKTRNGTIKNGELSEYDLKVLKLICHEFSNTQIADKMFLSPRTVEGYKKRLQKKVGAKSLIGLIIYAYKNNLIN